MHWEHMLCTLQQVQLGEVDEQQLDSQLRMAGEDR